jgi:hypothetical protein
MRSLMQVGVVPAFDDGTLGDSTTLVQQACRF